MSTGSLFDSLFNVNRPQLNAYVAQGQAMTGLRTAQTQEALANAQHAVDENDANEQLEGNLTSLFSASGDPLAQQKGKAAANMMITQHGGPLQAIGALGELQKNGMLAQVADPNTPDANRLALLQAVSQKGDVGQSQNFGNQIVNATQPGAPPVVTQTPMSTAEIGQKSAQANLENAQAAQGGFNPHSFNSVDLSQYPELQSAVQDGRLDPSLLNSRTVNIYGQLAKASPGLDFNSAVAGGHLQRNPTMAQRDIVMSSLPSNLQNMTDLGEQLGFNDLRVVGRAQAWLKGQDNDPLLTEYMTVRNDTLMKLASVMRGVGMSDQAHAAEIEAANPTLSPGALDGWLRGQMTTLTPQLNAMHAKLHPNPGGGAPAASSGSGSQPTDLASLAAAELARRGITPQPGAAPAVTQPAAAAPGAQ